MGLGGKRTQQAGETVCAQSWGHGRGDVSKEGMSER